MRAPPDIQPTRCVRYRFRYSTCSRCEKACPHEAVRLSDEGVSIAADHCKACGLCVSACPTEAFAEPGLAPMALIEKARGRTTFTIACMPSAAAGDVQVPCLGALSPPLLAYLLSQGISLQLAGSGHCASCQHGPQGGQQLASQLEALEPLRWADREGRWATLELPHRPAPSPTRAPLDPPRTLQPDPAAASAARRGFFRRVANAGAPVPQPPPAPAAAAIPLRAIRAARTMASAQRDLLLMLGLAEADATLPAHASLPAGDLQLDPGCTGCEACARACPTAALQVRESTSAWAIGFEAALCVACGVCVEACQPRVLHLRAEVPAASFSRRPPMAIHGMPKRRCTRCDRSFIVTGDSALCEVCAGDEQDFEALFG